MNPVCSQQTSGCQREEGAGSAVPGMLTGDLQEMWVTPTRQEGLGRERRLSISR